MPLDQSHIATTLDVHSSCSACNDGVSWHRKDRSGINSTTTKISSVFSEISMNTSENKRPRDATAAAVSGRIQEQNDDDNEDTNALKNKALRLMSFSTAATKSTDNPSNVVSNCRATTNAGIRDSTEPEEEEVQEKANFTSTTTNESNRDRISKDALVIGTTGAATITTSSSDDDDTERTTQASSIGPFRRVFAPTLRAYLNQTRSLTSEKKEVEDDVTRPKPPSLLPLKYLPRPEWCGPLDSIMISELAKVPLDNRNDDDDNDNEDFSICWKRAVIMKTDNYCDHLISCVYNIPVFICYQNRNDDDNCDDDEDVVHSGGSSGPVPNYVNVNNDYYRTEINGDYREFIYFSERVEPLVHYGDVDLTTSVEGNPDEDCQSNNENGKENHERAENDDDDDDAHRNENRLEIIRDEDDPPINDQQISHKCEKEQNNNDGNDDCSEYSQDTDMHSENCWTDNSDNIFIHHHWHINEACKFVRRQLKSHAIYLDLKDNIWKTKQVPKSHSITKINDGHAASSSLISQHCTTEISYEGLIGRRYYARSTIGMNNNTILHMAIQEDATDIAMDIIRIEHSTFLYYSVHCTDRFDYSLQSSTLLETTNTMGLTPLSLAAQKGNTTIVRELLRCGVSMSFSPADHYTGSALMQAVHFKQQKVLECIIEYYLEKNPKKPLTELLESTNVNGTTPLMRAAQEGNVSAAESLLEHGASVNCENKSGMTPLMFAAQRGYSDVCRLLIEYGANTNAQTKENESTALLLACKRGHTAVVKVLVTRCELSLKNKKLETARQIIQKRIERRQAALRAHQRRDQSERNSSNGVSSRNDEKILLLLNPQTQVHLIQLEIREARHFEMIRIHTLLHQNRALIKLNDGSLTDVNSVESMMQSSKLPHPLHQELQNALDRPCTQMLIRSMMLPASLLTMISSFLPLTNLWEERIEQLRDDYPRFTNSEDKVVYALDIIDEILEEGGFLLACDKARIPAPTPHQTWCDWKRHAKAQAAWSDEDCENGVLSFDYSTSRLNLESIDVMTSFPPSPQDTNNPTICELRRLVGYSSLLAQYQSTTDIVPTLMAEPYHIPRLLIDKFIRIADLSSLCRRCCTEQCLPYSLSVHGNHDVSFSSTAASSVLDLASEFHKWYNEQNK